LEFRRVQFPPDMLPSDLTGTMTLQRGELAFRPGPVFTHVLLADEVNRTPPKTQAALLEAMQERQVTIEGEPRPLPAPFLVVATQNPIEYEGTYSIGRSEEHTSELQSPYDLVCRLLLERNNPNLLLPTELPCRRAVAPMVPHV